MLLASWRGFARQARLDTSPDDTDTVLDLYGDPPVGLPNHEPVYFRSPDPADTWSTRRRVISARRRESGLVEIVSVGGHSLSVFPQASNVVYVCELDRDVR